MTEPSSWLPPNSPHSKRKDTSSVNTAEKKARNSLLPLFLFLMAFFILYIKYCGIPDAEKSMRKESAANAPSLYLKKGDLNKYASLPNGRKLLIMKKNGSYDNRVNDLEELCKDWIYYRNKIIKLAGEGDSSGAAKARASFNEVNINLSEYEEKDVQKMFSLIGESGYKSQGG